MDDLLNQIHRALDAELYYVALMVALAVPDICGAIDSTDGKADGRKYGDWFKKNMEALYNPPGAQVGLTGEDCYHFRCSLLHQGRTTHPKSNYSRILFFEPGGQVVMHGSCLKNSAEAIYTIDVREFCADMVSAARIWLRAVEGTPLYLANTKDFIKRLPQGFPPMIKGMAVYT